MRALNKDEIVHVLHRLEVVYPYYAPDEENTALSTYVLKPVDESYTRLYTVLGEIGEDQRTTMDDDGFYTNLSGEEFEQLPDKDATIAMWNTMYVAFEQLYEDAAELTHTRDASDAFRESVATNPVYEKGLIKPKSSNQYLTPDDEYKRHLQEGLKETETVFKDIERILETGRV